MTITITVSAKGFTWSRSGSISDIDAAIVHTSERTETQVVGASDGTELGDGMHSYNAVAVACIVNSGPGSLLKALTVNDSDATTGGAAVSPNLPFIVYNSAGGGFTGGVSSGASATITPTDDIDRIQLETLMGTPIAQVLIGLKPTS